jgi:hypothetical protein
VSDILDLIDGAISNYEWTGEDAMRWAPPETPSQSDLGAPSPFHFDEHSPNTLTYQMHLARSMHHLQAALAQQSIVFERTGRYLVEFWAGRRPVISRVGRHQILIGTFRLPLPTMESIAKRARLRRMHTNYHRRHR